MDKKTIRQEIIRIFKTKNEEELLRNSRKTAGILFEQKIWEESEIILIFLSFAHEFRTEPIIEEAFNQKKKVAIPRIYGKELKFHYIESLNEKFELNQWHIKEPLESSPSWIPEDGPALMLTPGLAFNKKGGRLGRGGGFYDRFLSEYGESLFTVALCFEDQIRVDIPLEEHDYILDAVCSDLEYQST